jgi:succinate-acetate transporter protein
MSDQTTFNVVNQAVADPSTVGLASFGIALFTLSFHNAGLLGPNDMSVIIPLALVTGLIHFFACLNGFKKNELFTAVVFGLYGMFWATYALINFIVSLKWIELDAKALMIFLIAYTIFTGIIFISTFPTNKVVILTLAILLAVFLCLDFGLAAVIAGKETKLIVMSGYLGMIDGLLALYLTAAGLFAANFGRSVLPVGPVK